MKLTQQLLDFEDVIDKAEAQTKVGQWLDHIGCVNTVILDLSGKTVAPGCVRYESVRFRKLADGTPVAYHRVRVASEPFPVTGETELRDLRFLEKLEVGGRGEELVWMSPPEAEIEAIRNEVKELKAEIKKQKQEQEQNNANT